MTTQFKFKPTILAIMSTILGVSLFVSLGQWQLQRAHEKEEMLAHIKNSMTQDAIKLPALNHLQTPETWRYQRMFFTATPVSERQFLLDNQVYKQQAGFNVLSLFQLFDGNYVLVDRGWIAAQSDRNNLPDIDIVSDTMRVEGYLYAPYGEPFKLGTNKNPELRWPHILPFLDFAEIRTRSGVDIPDFTIRLDPKTNNGYTRYWPPPPVTVNKHIAYAVQWFALAATVLIIFLCITIKRKKQ